jgi:hypothetical protein
MPLLPAFGPLTYAPLPLLTWCSAANKVFTWEEGKQMYDEYLVYPPPAAPPPP